MNLYFASNIGGGAAKYEIMFICLAGLSKRLFSYHYHKKATGMDLYFAGGENKSWLKAIELAGGEKSLYSYYYLIKDNKTKVFDFMNAARSMQKKLFLDSGGFSAYTKGIRIDIRDYIKFIQSLGNKIENYAVLDVIGDHKKTMANQRIMEKEGLSPIPVFHAFSDLSALKELVSEYKYIALGGLVPLARKKDAMRKWLSSCFSIIKNNSKIHGFGMTSFDMMLEFPFYSVDSTSWLGGSMRAEVYRFDGVKIKNIKTTVKKSADHETVSFTDDNDKKWMSRVIKNAVEWKKVEEYVTNVWKKRGVSWDD